MKRIDNPQWRAHLVPRLQRDAWDLFLYRPLPDGRREVLTDGNIVTVVEADTVMPAALVLNGLDVANGALQAIGDACAEHVEAPPTKELVAELRAQLERAEARVDLVIDKALQ